MSWDEMQPELVQMIASDRMGGKIMKAILYIIIAFGILGTVIMMFSERRRELGVMVSVGMQKALLAGILFTETFYIGVLGVVAGIGATIPLTIWFYHHPIHVTGEAAKAFLDMGVEPVYAFSLMPSVFYNQAITVFVLILLIALYPVIKTFGLNVSEALRT
jgi:ABC-type lipoprotein release transport system permease subunit